MKRRIMRESKDDLRYADDIYFVIDDPKDLNYAGIIWDVVIDDKHFITTEESRSRMDEEEHARDKVIEWCVENSIDVPIKTFNDLIIYEDDFDDFEEFDDWIWDNYEVCCETNYFIPNEYFGGIEDVTQEVRGEVRYNDEDSEFINKLKKQFGIDEDEKVNFNESRSIKRNRKLRENKRILKNRRMLREDNEDFTNEKERRSKGNILNYSKNALADYLNIKPKEIDFQGFSKYDGCVYDVRSEQSEYVVFDNVEDTIDMLKFIQDNTRMGRQRVIENQFEGMRFFIIKLF